MDNSLANGRNIIEIDFRMSSDGELICIHEWTDAWLDGVQKTEAMTKDEFLNCKMHGEFTSMCLEDIINYLKENKNLYIVTDIKDGNLQACTQIANRYPELVNRFIVQIYNEREYDNISSLGFSNILFTLYGTSEEERSYENLKYAAEQHNLIGFTFWGSWADDEDFFNKVKSIGIPMYVHTINDIAEQERYFDMGIDAIYTDVVEY